MARGPFAEALAQEWNCEFQAADGIWRTAGGRANFTYSDGAAVEARLLDFVRSVSDRSVLSMELRKGIVDWPSRYYLSPVRANLLRPLAHAFQGRRILEIGAGCGALTRFLAESGGSVLALEGSPARARIAAARCAGMDQVSVLAAPLQEFQGEACFDIVTLIGVLEYARIFFGPAEDGIDPVDAMLARARRLLRPGGCLIVGIENQLGLKYFAGCREDHVALPMFGIDDQYEDDGVVTFGRKELGARLSGAGLQAQTWLYPFPDYKLPTCVLTEAGIRGAGGSDLSPLMRGSVVADPQAAPRFGFSLEQGWGTVFRNGLAGDLANSFLVVASQEAHEVVQEDSLGWHYAVDRLPAYAKSVEFSLDATGVRIRPRALASTAPTSAGISWNPAEEPFRGGQPWQVSLFRRLNWPGWKDETVVAWARRWIDELSIAAGIDGLQLATRIDGRWLDAVPRNLMVGSGAGSEFIDLEWGLAGGIELGHLLYRGVVLSLMAVSSVAAPADRDDLVVMNLFRKILGAYGFQPKDDEVEAWHLREREFQQSVTGAGHWLDFDSVRHYRLTVREGI